MTKIITLSLFLSLIFIFVSAGPQQHGAWKESANQAATLGSISGALSGLVWGGPIGGAIGLGVGIFTFLAGGPGTSIFRCFEPNTMLLTLKGQVSISKLSQNDVVFTHDNKTSKVLKIDRDDRMHEFIKISTDIGFLEVTPDHLMIVNQKLIQAHHLEIGQYLGQHQITNIETTKKIGKVTIFTSQGSVIANGIPTTTICAEYEGLPIDEGIKKWNRQHRQLYPQLMK